MLIIVCHNAQDLIFNLECLQRLDITIFCIELNGTIGVAKSKILPLQTFSTIFFLH